MFLNSSIVSLLSTLKLSLNYQLSTLHFLTVGVGLGGVEDFIAVHDGDEVFCVAQIDDVVGVTREHVDSLDVVARDLELDDLVGAQLTLLDEAVALYYDELRGFCVLPSFQPVKT